MSTGAHILVADHAEGFGVFRDAYASALPLVHVDTLAAAKTALADRPVLVVCGCHFDEGRFYDLLRYLKSLPDQAGTPFLAVRCLRGEMLLEDTLYESVKIAVHALGGNAFVDLLRWQQRWGEAEASHRLTRLVGQLLAGQPADDTGS
jgi:hypothetical protein